MKVELKNTWFAPDAGRRKKGQHTVPDVWVDRLPPSAKVLVGPKVASPADAPEPAKEPEPAEPVEPKAGKKK